MGFDIESVNEVLRGLQKHEHKEVPFYLLYDQAGSELYKEITKLECYYPFEAEKALLEKHAQAIAAQIAPDSVIVELGCGTGDKTALILNAIQAKHQRCHYAGIDVSESALKEAGNLFTKVKGLTVDLVRADYLEGLRIIRNKYPEAMICILWLGSSIGNICKSGCVTFAKTVLDIVGPRCQFFICVDMWKEESTLLAAYCDGEGITEKFVKNGVKHGLSLLGHVANEDEMRSWIYEVDINHKLRQVEMYIRFPQGLKIAQHKIDIRENERVLTEISRKFTEEDMLQLASDAGFVSHAKWSSKAYGCYLMFSSEEAVLRCWRDTDRLFKGISNWMARPIAYRHPFCFYYGHAISFTKIKLLKDEPQSTFDVMFSRGIDPIVVDTTKCHSHPEVPAQWPDTDTIKEYVRSRRAMVLDYLKAGNVNMRLVNLILEHECMHQETLSYMLVQQRKIEFEEGSVLLPLKNCEVNGWKPSIGKPDVLISPGKVVLGSDPKPGVFKFDNEQPAYSTEVQRAFLVSSSPVSIGEFMSFILAGGYSWEELWGGDEFQFVKKTGQMCPATWSLLQGEYYVHFPECTHQWSEVAHRPVYVSLMEAEAFCKWVGYRIMTEAEYHRILDEDPNEGKVKHLRDGGWEWTSTAFHPFPGFSPMAEYPEYSVDFFDGQHYVLKGSSPVTHLSMLRDSFRNFYQREYPYVFAKFRCCYDLSHK